MESETMTQKVHYYMLQIPELVNGGAEIHTQACDSETSALIPSVVSLKPPPPKSGQQ